MEASTSIGSGCDQLKLAVEIICFDLKKVILDEKEVLLKPGSDFIDYGSCNQEISSNACPKCQSPILCAYADMARTEFADTYNHICMNRDCDYMIKGTVYGMVMGERDNYGPPNCPFCGRNV